ncbi:MAG: hypothetical protein ACO31I_14335, partial [Prochlorotrichaceae cyanobacterium]
MSNSKLKIHHSKLIENVPVANPAPKYPKPRKLVADLAAFPGEGFSDFSSLFVCTLYAHLREGSQMP